MTTIGQRLKKSREEQRLTLDKVFEATRIRVQYLQALEADDLSVMPSPVQARGYLRNYAEYLGLDVGRLLDDMREANAQKLSEEVIGPADVAESEETQTPGPEPVDAVAPLEDTVPLIKPKPVRRKKAEPPLDGDSATTPRRRTRKIVEPEAEVLPPHNGEASYVLEDETRQPPAAPPENLLPDRDAARDSSSPMLVPESGTVSMEASQQPVTEESSSIPVENSQPETPPSEPDVNDSLWRSWMNRLTSVLAARNRRSTLVPNQEIIAEIESTPSLLEASAVEQPIDENNPSSESSTQIFREIGAELRNRRELLSLHLEEVERNTHVKGHYLDALERGAMDDLPSTVQTRGMLSNYATFLDLDVDALLLRFADALQARHRERNPQKPMRKPGQPSVANLPPIRSFIAGDLVFGVGIVVLLVGFAIWGVSRVLELQSQREANPTAPSISEILLSTPDTSAFTATPTFLSVDAFPGEATVTVEIPTLSADVNVQVNLVAVERTYMRVIVDGKTAFEGRVVPGTAYPFEAVDQVEVLVGSGAAIRIVYNGRDMGLLGSFGQVVSNIYRTDEIVTPTGAPSPTATVTLTPTRTPVPSPTSRFTVTPVQTGTPVP